MSVKEFPFCGSAETNLTGLHEDAGSILDLNKWVKGSGVAVSRGVGCRCGLDPGCCGCGVGWS